MNIHEFNFRDVTLHATSNGALYWPDNYILVVSDLHLGKSERIARRGGQMLPPYETIETLNQLEAVIRATDPRCVICLGDSFDDLDAGRNLPDDQAMWLTRLMARREWIWIEGNHDPGPLEFGGTHLEQYQRGCLVFRHIATSNAQGEISGHYHPKTQLILKGRAISRPSFLVDSKRLIMPSFGTYTGGLFSNSEALKNLMETDAKAILTGPTPCIVPMQR